MPPTKHTCHVPGCKRTCPPAHLMCSDDWRKVPKRLQAEVYRTVGMRDMSGCDRTWAPWWRAAHRAIAHVMLSSGKNPKPVVDAWLARAMQTADEIESGK